MPASTGGRPFYNARAHRDHQQVKHIEFSHVMADITAAGMQLHALGAAEGSAGNISVCVGELVHLDEAFTLQGKLELPVTVPHLAGAWIVVTGTGRRLRDIGASTQANVVVLNVLGDGTRALWYAAGKLRPSSEWNSHLAVHCEAWRRGAAYHAVVHAQPHDLTYLSHHPLYETREYLSNRLLRWEPETIVMFPNGVGMVPFRVPGSGVQMEQTAAALRDYRLVVWQKHGVVARSGASATHAADLVEYAEMAARYEVLNLSLGSPAPGLTDEELQAICNAYHIEVPAFLRTTP